MKEIQLARRYAIALFAVAGELNLTAKVAEDFGQLKTVIAENRDFRTMLSSPVIPAHKKSAIIKALFSSHMQELSINFMNLLTRNGRERYLATIAEQVEVLYKDFMGIVSINVISAQPLNESNRQEITLRLKQILGERIELHETIDPSIMGGFVLEWGDQRYDASLLREIKELRKEFQENLYIRQF